MSIILIEEEDSVKYSLLRESLQDEVNFKPLRDQKYQNYRNSFFRSSRFSPKNRDEELTDWNSNSVYNSKEKPTIRQIILPKMKNNRKSIIIQDLSRQLLKYQQFNSNEDDIQPKFRLKTLKQMTKKNFIKPNPIKIESPKKIDLKLEFPGKYQRNRKERSQNQLSLKEQNDDSVESYMVRKSNQGLIPSMKKLSPFFKKSMIRSKSERDPYQNKKTIIRKDQLQLVKKSSTDELKQRVDVGENEQSLNVYRINRHEIRLPLGFLSYSFRKQSNEKVQKNDSLKKPVRSSFFIDPPVCSYEPQLGVIGMDISDHKRFSEYMFLSVNRKKFTNRE